jgi:inosine-uridine nucleoside N-ribohydrolase
MRPDALLVFALLVSGCASSAGAQAASAPAGPTPVILDTDIGDDIDDTWALAMLLKSPQLDTKLVTTTCGKSEYRAKLIAKLLEAAKRADIPVGLGAGGKGGTGGQQAWVKDYDLSKYPGKVHQDGVQALIDVVMKSPVPVVILGVGPNHTVAAALEREPAIAGKAVFVGMQGAVRKGYDGGKVCPEYNVKAAVAPGKKVLGAPWKECVITPLDTCGLVRLRGARFQAVVECPDPLVKALVENYRIWAKKENVKESSILFDTVAIYLAYPGPKSLVEMEDLKIIVTDTGVTAIDPAGAKMAVATNWKSLDAYNDLLVEILTGTKPAGK